MSTTHEIEPGRLIDLSCEVVGLDRTDRRGRIVEQIEGRPPERIDGLIHRLSKDQWWDAVHDAVSALTPGEMATYQAETDELAGRLQRRHRCPLRRAVGAATCGWSTLV